MTPEFKLKARQLLIDHEGWKKFLYQDSVGKWTIGVGYNIQDRGLPDNFINLMLNNDIEFFYNELYNRYFWFKELNEARQLALVDMAFMGLKRFAEFARMISALRLHNYDIAADEMLNSKWAKQVGQRAYDLAKIMRTGEL